MGILIEFNYKGKSECGEGQDRVSSTLQIPLNISSSGAASRENVILQHHSPAGSHLHTGLSLHLKSQVILLENSTKNVRPLF